MIDTVVLKILKHKLKYIDPRFYSSYTKSEHHEKFIRNMTTKEKQNGIYRPRLTGSRRNYQIPYIKIEFSCPKLIYGNNLHEVEPKDFNDIIRVLQKNLKEMGVEVNQIELRNAEIMAFHPSKNIPLSNGYTATHIIKELAKINLSKQLDLTKTNFRNGLALQYYSNSHSLVFYDKIADLNKPKKRAIDKDQTYQQLNLFREIKSKIQGFQVLRMEVRLCNKRKIDSLMKKLGLETKPKFKDLFKNNLCQKILLWYWEEIIINNNIFLFGTDTNPHQLLKNELISSSNLKLKEAIYRVGLQALSKDKQGIRGLRLIVENSFSNRSWFRINSDLKDINNNYNTFKSHQWVKQIENSLSCMKPIDISLDEVNKT